MKLLHRKLSKISRKVYAIEFPFNKTVTLHSTASYRIKNSTSDTFRSGPFYYWSTVHNFWLNKKSHYKKNISCECSKLARSLPGGLYLSNFIKVTRLLCRIYILKSHPCIFQEIFPKRLFWRFRKIPRKNIFSRSPF